MKKLYRIWQEVNNDWDTYSDAVVCAESAIEARVINPGGYRVWHWEEKEVLSGRWVFKYNDGRMEPDDDNSWCHPRDVKVEELGVANEDVGLGVVCASFHAG